MNYNDLINGDFIFDVDFCGDYFAAFIDWFALDIKVREGLLKDIQDKELEYEDQWYYAAIIIPCRDKIPEPEKAFLFLDDFAPVQGGFVEGEIAKYTHGEDSFISPYVRRLDITTTDKVHMLSWLIPSCDMRKEG